MAMTIVALLRLSVVFAFLLVRFVDTYSWTSESCDCKQIQQAVADSNMQVRSLENEAADLRVQLEARKKEVADLQAQLKSQKPVGHVVRRAPWDDDEKLDMFSSLPMKEVEVLGQVFLGLKVSEILMNKTVAKWFGYDTSLQEKQVGFSGAPLLAISIPISAGEASDGMLLASTLDIVSTRMERWGVVVLQDILPKRECDDMLNYIFTGPDSILKPTYGFSDVSEKALRKDYPLLIDASTMIFFDKVIKLVGPALKAKLSENAILVEFSSMASFPGARQQDVHPDAQMERIGEARIFTVFVSLTDVEDTRAALDVQPGTHTHFQFLLSGEVDMLVSAPLVRCAVPKGSIVIMDSRLYHRGNANLANKTRAVFYFSFMEPGIAPNGPTYSLRSYYEGKITLKDAIIGDMLKKALAQAKGRSMKDLEGDLEEARSARDDIEKRGLSNIHELEL